MLALLALWWRGRDDGRLRVWLLDVGQGECVVARWQGRTIVVDGGSSDRERVGRQVLVPFLQMNGVRRVDALFVSHPDADHFNGLPDLVREVPVERLYLARHILGRSTAARADEWSRFLALCRSRGTAVEALGAPQVLRVPAANGSGSVLTLRALWPPEMERARGSNEGSLVLKIGHGASGVLLTGDAGEATERALLRDPLAAGVTVLKVGHHGSKGSTSEAFLQHARPSAAVISCGRYNSFGHPSPQVLDRLAQRGIRALRTDLDGTIEISCGERECELSSFR